MNIYTHKIYFAAAFVLVIFSPFSNIIHAFFPVFIFGKSVYVFLVVITLFVFYFYGMLGGWSSSDRIIQISTLLTIFSVLVIIEIIRTVIHGQSRGIESSIFMLVPVVSYYIGVNIGGDRLGSLIFLRLIVMGGLLVGTVRLANSIYFPYLRIDEETQSLTFDGFLTRDMLLGSSISASIIVTAIYSLFVIRRLSNLKSDVYFLILIFYLFYSMLNTESRMPIALGFLLLIYSLYTDRRLLAIKFFLPIFSIIAGFFYIEELMNVGVVGRLGEDSGRIEKFNLFVKLIMNSTVDLLIGPSADLVINTSSSELVFSDNSFGEIALQFGVIASIIFFILFILNIKWRRLNLLNSIAMVIIVLQLLVTNSIYWTPWIINAFFILGLLSKLDNLNLRR